MRIAKTFLVLVGMLTCASCEDVDWIWDDETPVCAPSTVAECACETGGPGTQTCEADGLEYSVCECVPGDAGVDAVPDAS